MKAHRIKNHPNLYMVNDGFVYLRFYYRGKDYWITTGCRTLTAAKNGQIYKDFASQDRETFLAARQEATERPTRLLSLLVDEYLKHAKRMDRRDMEKRTHSLKRLEDSFKGKTCEEIRREDMERFRDILAESPILKGRSKKIMAKATVNRYLEYASAFFSWCLKRGLVKSNPCTGVERFKEVPSSERYLHPEEEAKLLESCQDWFRPWVVFALEMGARKGEIARLERRDVDLRKGKRGWVTFRNTKSWENRSIPLTPNAAALVKGISRRLDHSYLFTGPEGESLVTDDERGYYEWPLESAMREACANSGIGHIRFHDLRHTWASRCVMRGVNLYTLQKLAGWRSYEMVKRYAHLQPDHLEAAMDTPETGESRAAHL